MARIRTVKPDFFVDEDIGRLQPITRLVYEGLWCHADKEGRLEYRPDYLKVQIMPYDNADMCEQLDLLMASKPRTGIPFILRYEVEGVSYIQIIAWGKHQRPHHTESESTLPPPSETVLEQVFSGKGTVRQRLSNGEATDGREGKGRERKGRKGGDATSYSDDCLKPTLYLNKKAGTHYEPTNQSWLGMISARLREGYTLDDFMAVIDHKVEMWGSDEKMRIYLRPSTLFTANHMEGYLSEAKRGVS